MAARHYANAQDPLSAMRVLGSAAGDALGTGAWGAVVEIVDMMPSTPPPTAVKVIQARALISDERPQAAIELLQSIDRSSLTADERGLVRLTWAAIHHMNGENGLLHDEVDAIVSDASVPSLLRDVGVSWQLMLQAASGGSVADAVSALRLMASEQSKLDLHYFAGITLHNASAAELARGKYREAIELGDRSLYHLAKTDEHSSIAPSTRSIQAAALAEQGDLEEGLRLATAAATGPDATADAIAEAAYLHAVCGRTQRGRTLLMRFDRGDARWARDPPAKRLVVTPGTRWR